MTTAHITSLIVTTELAAERSGSRGVRFTSAGRSSGDRKATREIVTPSFSMPVVRELHPRSPRSVATW